MKLRLAKPSDAKLLAKVHEECGAAQVGGFMHKLGLGFLTAYYRLFLAEKSSVILIGYDSTGAAAGFSSGTTDAQEHLENLRKHRMALAAAMLPRLVLAPRIIPAVMHRNRVVSTLGSGEAMLVSSGARGEYWAWRPTAKDPAAAVVLRQAWCNILADLGCKTFRYELDLANSDVAKFQTIFGCRVISEFTLADGRRRAMVEEDLRKPRRSGRPRPTA